MEPIQIVRRFYDTFGDGNLDAATSVFAEDVSITDPGLGTVQGIRAMRDYLCGLKAMVPDATAIVERTFEVGDTVIVEGRFTGTNTGPVPGPDGERPPSGRAVDLPFADFSRIAGGKIAEYRTYYDQVALLTKLGLMEG